MANKLNEPFKIIPNCYPSCTYNGIPEYLLDRQPCIDITVLDNAMLLQNRLGSNIASRDIILTLQTAGFNLDSSQNQYGMEVDKNNQNRLRASEALSNVTENSLEGRAENLQDTLANLMTETTEENDVFHLMNNLYGFWSLLSTSMIGEFCDIPITSNQIQVKTNNNGGFKDSQSLFSFIQSFLKGDGLLASFLQFGNIGGIANGLMNDLETFGAWFGWNPRVSPYFSFKENVFGNKPILNVSTHLINDSREAIKNNAKFLNTLVKKSLIGTETAKQTNSLSKSSLLGEWRPPNLFTVGLKFGKNGKYIKKYHLCTLDSTVTMDGVMRKVNKRRIPDAYIINMAFKSIIPDTVDAWLSDGFPLASGEAYYIYGGKNGETIKETAAKFNKEQHIPVPKQLTDQELQVIVSGLSDEERRRKETLARRLAHNLDKSFESTWRLVNTPGFMESIRDPNLFDPIPESYRN